jgi:hypothetical protein
MTELQRTYHIDGTLPKNGEFLVFGSNTAGVHGAGAAKVARFLFNARLGDAEGLTGKSYAVLTRRYDKATKSLVTLSLKDVEASVSRFCKFTKEHPDMKWWVTGVGCGHAGFSARQIAPLFREAINCSFPSEWKEHLEYYFRRTDLGNFPMVGVTDEY